MIEMETVRTIMVVVVVMVMLYTAWPLMCNLGYQIARYYSGDKVETNTLKEG